MNNTELATHDAPPPSARQNARPERSHRAERMAAATTTALSLASARSGLSEWCSEVPRERQRRAAELDTRGWAVE